MNHQPNRDQAPLGASGRISFDQLVDTLCIALERAGASPEVAKVLARNHAACERDGSLSHGVFRIPQLVETLQSGYLLGTAVPTIEHVSNSYLRVNADGGIAQLALEHARTEIMRALSLEGVAIVAIRDSQHHSALWPDLEPFADAGYIALTMVTGGEPHITPRGAHHPVLSTNPFAFATPVADAHPLIVDFATSAMSYGDLTLAAQAGQSVPVGTGLDATGADTTDAQAIVTGGSLLPFGGHKGAMLSAMVELLASGLTGGDYSFEASTKKPNGAHSTRTGQFLLVIDPNRGASHSYTQRAALLIDALREAGSDRLPADLRYRRRAEAETLGIPVTPLMRDLFLGTQEPH